MLNHLVVIALAIGCIVAGAASSAALSVAASDRDGKPLADAVIFVKVPGPPKAPPAEPLEMSQENLMLSPYVLPIQAGSYVAFPNKDKVAHHLKTFSTVYEFEFPIYDPGRRTVPILFDKVGSVTLFCYIHGWMRAYVYVVDTPHFATTDALGLAVIDGLPEGAMAVRGWHPNLRGEPLTIAAKTGAATTQLAMKFDLIPRERLTPRK